MRILLKVKWMPHSRHFNMLIERVSLDLAGLFKVDEDQIKLGGVWDKFFVSNNIDINLKKLHPVWCVYTQSHWESKIVVDFVRHALYFLFMQLPRWFHDDSYKQLNLVVSIYSIPIPPWLVCTRSKSWLNHFWMVVSECNAAPNVLSLKLLGKHVCNASRARSWSAKRK